MATKARSFLLGRAERHSGFVQISLESAIGTPAEFSNGSARLPQLSCSADGLWVVNNKNWPFGGKIAYDQVRQDFLAHRQQAPLFDSSYRLGMADSWKMRIRPLSDTPLWNRLGRSADYRTYRVDGKLWVSG